MSKYEDTSYDRLVIGIVHQAAKDLHAMTYHNGVAKPNLRIRTDARKFFLSDWFEFLTGCNGERILKQLTEVEDKE